MFSRSVFFLYILDNVSGLSVLSSKERILMVFVLFGMMIISVSGSAVSITRDRALFISSMLTEFSHSPLLKLKYRVVSRNLIKPVLLSNCTYIFFQRFLVVLCLHL